MFKVGYKAAHFMTSNRVGKVVEINYVKNNQWTIGGTTDSKVYILLEYPNGEKVQHLSGNLLRIYD